MERDEAGRLVGRDLELSTLDRLLADLARDGGGLVLVTGEPGIGKSTLLAEAARRTERSGGHALRGVCWEGEAPSYWPWKQVVRGLRDLLGGLPDGPLAGLLEGTGTDGVAATDFDLYDAVGQALVDEARRSPLVVLLDDLQWADDGSLRLLEFLRAVAAGEPLLVVAAYRDHEGSPRLEALAAGAVSLPLAGLDREAVVTLMTDVAGPRPPDALATRVADRCHGNPFFVRETARLAFSSSGGWADVDESGTVPAGVRAVVRRRLEQLGEGCRDLLDLVAVAGGDVEDDVLDAAAGRSDLAALLEESGQARVTRHHDGRVGFVHDLFRDVVLADLSAEGATEMHRRLATALSPRRTTSHDVVGRLAVHLAAAGDDLAVEAMECSVEAARAVTLGHEEACRHYERALALLGRLHEVSPAGSPDRLQLELELAVARAAAGHRDDARGDLAALAMAARTTGRAEILADAALANHALGSRTSTQMLTALALLDDAVAALPADDAARASRLRAARSRMLSRIPGRSEDAWTAAREAAELAQADGDRSAEFDALLAQHDLLWSDDGRVTADGADERHALCDDLVRLVEADPAGEEAAIAHQLRAAVLIERGDPEGLTELVRHADLAQALGTMRGRWWATTRRATVAAIDGRADDALALSTDGLRLGTLMGEPDAAGCDASLRASLALLGVDGAIPPPPANDPLFGLRHVLAAALALVGGDLERARAEAAAGLPADDAFGSTDLLAICAWVWAACGPDGERAQLLEMLEPWAGRHFVVGGCAAYYGPVDRLRGDLATALGRHADAERWYDAARAAARGLGAPSWAPRPDVRPAPRVDLTRDGATWRLTFDGRVVHLPDAKGLQDLATLVANPGREVHVLTLLGRPGPAPGADPVLDDSARAAYRQRLADIERELDEADRVGDPASGAALTEERARLLAELASATGLGGRARRLGDETEGARKTVGARIRDSLRRVEEVHPTLGAHLRESLSIGTVCTYTPEATALVHDAGTGARPS